MEKIVTKFLVYRNRYNEVKGYSVEVHWTEDGRIDVWDLGENRHKTFLEENILEEIGSLDEAISRASVLQQDYVVRERTARGQFSNTQGKIEVCFTGFSKADREELEKLATDNELFVRTGVTKKLGQLVLGENAGPKKLMKAIEMGVARVSGREEFFEFLANGEVFE